MAKMFKFTRSEQIIIAVLVFVLIFVNLGIYIIGQKQQKQAVELESNIKMAVPVQYDGLDSKKQLLVHISGEVEMPGIYRFPAGSRIYQVFQRAKIKPSGYVEHLNLAAYLTDGQKIYVPEKRGMNRNKNLSLANQASAPRKININTSTVEELETLHGIGPEYARRIIEYRNDKRFTTIEEIMRIRGIGLKRFQKIKGKICVN